MLKRTLLALYHPNNRYVVHLDLESPPDERLDLQRYVAGHAVFTKFGNVRMITKANLVTYRGPTMVANTLHAAAILLKEGGEWDWFINLSASDYPLVTQDGENWLPDWNPDLHFLFFIFVFSDLDLMACLVLNRSVAYFLISAAGSQFHRPYQ